MTETYSRVANGQTLVWNVDKLISLASALAVKEVSIAGIHELDQEMWFGGPRNVRPTVKEVVSHVRRIQNADLSRPIILSASGKVMDGMHRVAKALMEGRSHVPAYQFAIDPQPDEIRRTAT
jgi:hypothetical protein